MKSFYDTIIVDGFVKSHLSCRDGLWKKFDRLGVVSETVTWQYMWYGKSPFQIYNNVDRAFYESIIVDTDDRRIRQIYPQINLAEDPSASDLVGCPMIKPGQPDWGQMLNNGVCFPVPRR